MNTPRTQSVSELVNDLRQGHVTKLASAPAPSAPANGGAPLDPVAASREKIARAAREAQELLKQASAAAPSASPSSAAFPPAAANNSGPPVSSILPVSAPAKTASAGVDTDTSSQMALQASLASAELMGAAVFDGMLKRGSQYIQGRQIREAQHVKEANVANELYKVAQASARALDQVLSAPTQAAQVQKQASAQPRIEDVAQGLYKVAQTSASALDQLLDAQKQASAPPDPAGAVTLARDYVYQATGGRVDPKLAAHAHDIDITVNDIYQAMLREFDHGIEAAAQVFG